MMQGSESQSRTFLPLAAPFLFAVFAWYSVETIQSSLLPLPGGWDLPRFLLLFAFRALLNALVLDGLFRRLTGPPVPVLRLLADSAKRIFPRFLLVSLAQIALQIANGMLMASLLPASADRDPFGIAVLRSAPLLVVYLLRFVWQTGIVAEGGRTWRGLAGGSRALWSSRAYLLGSLAYCLLFTLDAALPETALAALPFPFALLVNLLRGAVISLAAVFLFFAAFRSYPRSEQTAIAESQSAAAEVAAGPVEAEPAAVKRRQKGRPRTWPAALCFLPVLSVVALVSGLRSGRRNGWTSIRSMIAFGLGLFFTLTYLFVIAGSTLDRVYGSAAASLAQIEYGFLSAQQPGLAREVRLLEQQRFGEALAALQKLDQDPAARGWPYLTARALARQGTGDEAGAGKDIDRALASEPAVAALQYSGGLLYCLQGRRADAENRLLAALELDGELQPARRLLSLLRSYYEPERLVTIVWSILILLVLFTAHEFAHAWMADRQGDDTARNLGRLTLNPLPHLDLFGSVILPAILIIRQADVVFGWAKPVPFDPEKLRDRKNGERLVAFAGPGMNLLMALGALLLILFLLLLLRLAWPQALTDNAAGLYGPLAIGNTPLGPYLAPVLAFLKQFLATSLMLGVVNLLPIPPLDGSWLLASALRGKWRAGFEKFRKFSFLIALALFLTPALDYLLLVPLTAVWVLLSFCAGFMGLG